MTKNKLANAGFTLIELLIVIVIIGILAGVVIGVLNPVQQQNRSRDAANRSAISKMALSTKSLFVSSVRSQDRSPTNAEFAQGVGNIGANNCSDDPSDGNTATGTTCSFVINGLTLPSTCGANNYTDGGSTPCQYVYSRTPTGFRIGVLGAAAPAVNFVYEYVELPNNISEGFYSCPVGTNYVGVSGTSFTVPTLAACSLLN